MRLAAAVQATATSHMKPMTPPSAPKASETGVAGRASARPPSTKARSRQVDLRGGSSGSGPRNVRREVRAMASVSVAGRGAGRKERSLSGPGRFAPSRPGSASGRCIPAKPEPSRRFAAASPPATVAHPPRPGRRGRRGSSQPRGGHEDAEYQPCDAAGSCGARPRHPHPAGRRPRRRAQPRHDGAVEAR